MGYAYKFVVYVYKQGVSIMSMRYNMDIVDYNDYAIGNINEDNRYDKYDVLRKVMYHYLCNWNEESINVKLSLFQNNKE